MVQIKEVRMNVGDTTISDTDLDVSDDFGDEDLLLEAVVAGMLKIRRHRIL
jgi:hypothetical protein